MTTILNDAAKPLAQFGMPLKELVFDHGLSLIHLIPPRIRKVTLSSDNCELEYVHQG
jgi:hypothetical protein